MQQSLSPGRLFTGLLEVKEFTENFPRKLNRVLDSIANNEINVRLDARNQAMLMLALQKVANRITVGLLFAALIVGAARQTVR
jgi:hypothetical protein